jgi:hypothetical protein
MGHLISFAWADSVALAPVSAFLPSLEQLEYNHAVSLRQRRALIAMTKATNLLVSGFSSS